MAKTIFVRAKEQNHQVVLSEADEQHPGPTHEAWICGDERVWEVGKTAAVMAKVTAGELEEVSATEAERIGVSPPPGSDAPTPDESWTLQGLTIEELQAELDRRRKEAGPETPRKKEPEKK